LDFCVVGNGLLGAAAALCLSRRGQRGRLIGAGPSESSALFSSHEDDVRLVRLFSDDPYWTELTLKNGAMLDDVMVRTSAPVFRALPLFYRFAAGRAPRHPHVRALSPAADGAVANAFHGADLGGGVLNPKLYVHSMNRLARELGCEVEQARVTCIARTRGGFRVTTEHGSVETPRVVDTRGLYCDALDVGKLSALGKIFLFTRGARHPEARSFAFIDQQPESDAFRDVYGVYRCAATVDPVSRFGFSERFPVRLRSREEIGAWFRGGFRDYPHLAEAKDWLSRFHGGSVSISELKPCAFTVTADARPWIVMDEGLLTISGCNGAAAKCCQALVEDALSTAGFVSS
jgi:glycine/D-amino acid oxidase-like deaminating enzyme